MLKDGGRTLVIKRASFGAEIDEVMCKHFLWKLLELIPEKSEELLQHLKDSPGVAIPFSPQSEDGKAEQDKKVLHILAGMINVLDGITCTVQTRKIWT